MDELLASLDAAGQATEQALALDARGGGSGTPPPR
eukprot:SAG25_NODE_7902_length_451_cov_0.730114_1_plen_34_part_10